METIDLCSLARVVGGTRNSGEDLKPKQAWGGTDEAASQLLSRQQDEQLRNAPRSAPAAPRSVPQAPKLLPGDTRATV